MKTLWLGAVIMGCALRGAAGEGPPPEGGAEEPVRSVIAGRPEYGKRAHHRLSFGDGYRKLWTTPFSAPVLNLGSFAGGLVPVRQVGSMQSLGLALKGADGRSYTFRTFDKDPTKILPPEWRDSLPARILQDQTAASHPGAALIVPTLAEAAGVPHAKPVAVFLPDDPALGKFRAAFGGRPGLICEYPLPARNGYPGFLGATEIIETGELWERWRKGEGWVDSLALLRARIFDLFLGDWDRHNGQWRWMRTPGHHRLLALPEDRDQALSNYGGLVLRLAKAVDPRFLGWRADYREMEGLLLQGREVDDWLLNGLDRDAFSRTAREVQAGLTDVVIEDAVRRLPSEWFALGGAQLTSDLKKRRDLLPQAAQAFYQQLAKYVAVQGTDRADLARITREADGSVSLELSLAGDSGEPGPPYFSRRFLRAETKEIRIYLYGGDDRLLTSGPAGGITTRVSGGPGADRLDDSPGGGTRFYDVEARSEVTSGPGTRVSGGKWVRIPRKPETPWMDKRDFGALTLVQPLVWWEPDPGVVLSFGATHYRYGFRKQPYASLQELGLAWKSGRSSLAATYSGDFRWSRPGLGTTLDVTLDGARNYNFYGFGNRTPTRDSEFAEADQRVLEVSPSLLAYQNSRQTLSYSLGPELKLAWNRAAADTLIGTTRPYGFGEFGQAGARLHFRLDSRGRPLSGLFGGAPAAGSKPSDSGLTLEVAARVYPKAWPVQEKFGSVSGALAGYWQPASRLTLAGRVGAQRVWGVYPWHEAAFIGGSDTVRGYGRNRFAGDASLYANGQVMLGLFNMTFLLPVRVGVLGLADVGRVWLAGEASREWHPAYGGGVFFRVLTTRLVLHGVLVHGDEGNRFYLNTGFGI